MVAQPGAIGHSLIGALLFALGSTTAYAAEVRWISSGDGDWNIRANWSGGERPGAGDDVVIADANVTVRHRLGDTRVRSITATGSVAVEGGVVTVTAPTVFSGELRVTTGGALRAIGTNATITATGTTAVLEASLYALEGATITLPQATVYQGPGVIRAQGTGSTITLANVGQAGPAGPPSGPDLDVNEAISREVSLFAVTGQRGPFGVGSADSREVSLFKSGLQDEDDALNEGISREVSLSNTFGQAEPSPVRETLSREVSLYKGDGSVAADTELRDAFSGEVSIENLFGQPPRTVPGLVESVSREVSVYKGDGSADSDDAFEEAFSRETSVRNVTE